MMNECQKWDPGKITCISEKFGWKQKVIEQELANNIDDAEWKK